LLDFVENEFDFDVLASDGADAASLDDDDTEGLLVSKLNSTDDVIL